MLPLFKYGMAVWLGTSTYKNPEYVFWNCTVQKGIVTDYKKDNSKPNIFYYEVLVRCPDKALTFWFNEEELKEINK